MNIEAASAMALWWTLNMIDALRSVADEIDVAKVPTFRQWETFGSLIAAQVSGAASTHPADGTLFELGWDYDPCTVTARAFCEATGQGRFPVGGVAIKTRAVLRRQAGKLVVEGKLGRRLPFETIYEEP